MKRSVQVELLEARIALAQVFAINVGATEQEAGLDFRPSNTHDALIGVRELALP